jgi:trehalose/maltose hydrolase-like predicted phosphorylase
VVGVEPSRLLVVRRDREVHAPEAPERARAENRAIPAKGLTGPGYGGHAFWDAETFGTFGFAPRLPDGLTRLAFSLLIQGRRLRVEVTHAEASYTLADGDPLTIMHHRQTVSLRAGKPQAMPIPAEPARPRPSQPPGREPAHSRPGAGNAT